jgi:hypothetical protein
VKPCSVASLAFMAISFLNSLDINIFLPSYTFYSLLLILPLENVCVITSSKNTANLLFSVQVLVYYKKQGTTMKNNSNVGYMQIT